MHADRFAAPRGPAMTRGRLPLLCAALLSLLPAAAIADDDLHRSLPPGVIAEREAPTPPALEQAIAARSAHLFDAIFVDCDPDAVASTITVDFEFHHDSWGTLADSREAFVERLRGQCRRRASGEESGSRRELVAGTQRVFPIGAEAALETGVHRFYVPTADGGETLTGIARYTHLWRREHGAWVVARILSYEHMDVR